MWVLLPSTRAEMTFPRVERERFICMASFRRSPVAFVLLCLSEPWGGGREARGGGGRLGEARGDGGRQGEVEGGEVTREVWEEDERRMKRTENEAIS